MQEKPSKYWAEVQKNFEQRGSGSTYNAAEVTNMFEYIVQPGDYLYSIATTFDVNVPSILAANPGLSPDNIYPGLIIYIPISNKLYQKYPFYIYYPYMFRSYPREYWNDRMNWPDGWRAFPGESAYLGGGGR